MIYTFVTKKKHYFVSGKEERRSALYLDALVGLGGELVLVPVHPHHLLLALLPLGFFSTIIGNQNKVVEYKKLNNN